MSDDFLEVRYCAACSNCKRKTICRVCAEATKIETGDYMGRPEYLCRYAKEKERLIREYGRRAKP